MNHPRHTLQMRHARPCQPHQKRGNSNQKAQTELIGLVMVVMLISVSMLFIIRFVPVNQQSGVKESYEQSQISSNMISSILETTVRCEQQDINIRMADLFKNCALFENYNCIPDNAESPQQDNWFEVCMEHEPGPDSCTLLNCTMKLIFKNSIEEWGRKYQFTAYALNDLSGRGPITNISNSECLYDKESEIYPLPLNPGTLILRLDICS